MIDSNAGAAALRAGYKSKRTGYSLINHPHIIAKLEELIKEQTKRIKITADATLQEIARVAFSDIRKLYDDEGNLKPVHQLDDDIAVVVMGFDKDGRPKFYDKNSALEKLGKHFKLWEDKVKVDASVTHKKDPTWDKDDPESIRRAYAEIFGTPPDTPGVGGSSGD